MEATLGIAGHQQAIGRGHPHGGDAGLALVLIAVCVAVIENLADDIRAIEGWIGHDADGGCGDVRQGSPRRSGHKGAVQIVAIADAGADHQQQGVGVLLLGREGLDRPGDHAVGNRRDDLDAIPRGGAVPVLEAGRQLVSDPDADQRHGQAVCGRDGVGHQSAARDRHQGRGLGHLQDARTQDRVQRDVVVQDRGRAAVGDHEGEEILGGGRPTGH